MADEVKEEGQETVEEVASKEEVVETPTEGGEEKTE